MRGIKKSDTIMLKISINPIEGSVIHLNNCSKLLTWSSIIYSNPISKNKTHFLPIYHIKSCKGCKSMILTNLFHSTNLLQTKPATHQPCTTLMKKMIHKKLQKCPRGKKSYLSEFIWLNWQFKWQLNLIIHLNLSSRINQFLSPDLLKRCKWRHLKILTCYSPMVL